jgi:hypothetical protein
MILNISAMPKDPIERIIWLDGVKEAVEAELDHHYETAYFDARLTRRFEAALSVGRASRKRALAWTRRANERRGRSVRWNDGADPTSTAYAGE